MILGALVLIFVLFFVAYGLLALEGLKIIIGILCFASMTKFINSIFSKPTKIRKRKLVKPKKLSNGLEYYENRTEWINNEKI
ncbi:hypothetical protein U728_694 [Clostridium botulinum 202F]|nr:hypothetical protein U728_694 [Clostridium botulinum 202F]KON14067.1 hypothetical protein ACP50_04260 [Clostridium botulinum]MBY6988513.1 hypothetical protein [Clostridium botulinum]NFH01441.1 hypothetical protein [Clostridium botulinum]NFP40746.1 hypothetical protein [Clostridium botulinum]